jgi:hypothetical protein
MPTLHSGTAGPSASTIFSTIITQVSLKCH